MPKIKVKEKKVVRVFSSLAPHYDRWVGRLSLQQVRKWRKMAVAAAAIKKSSWKVLDVCSGTGEMAIALAGELNATGRVFGLDFCPEMLAIAREKSRRTKFFNRVEFVLDNALHMPFADECFDCITLSFALADIVDRPKLLREVYRVLKVGGRFVVLELARPVSGLHDLLFQFVEHIYFPFLLNRLPGEKEAREYLRQMFERMPSAATYAAELSGAGFEIIDSRAMAGGIAWLWLTQKGKDGRG